MRQVVAKNLSALGLLLLVGQLVWSEGFWAGAKIAGPMFIFAGIGISFWNGAANAGPAGSQSPVHDSRAWAIAAVVFSLLIFMLFLLSPWQAQSASS